MRAFSEPFSRIFLVSRRVSIPYSAGTLFCVSHWESDRAEFQCEWWCE